MTPDLVSNPIDQELIVHLYTALDGSQAVQGYEQIRRIWERCRDELGMDQPIADTGLPATLPSDPKSLVPGRPAAAQEHPTADFQAVVRREHDVVNLSVALAAPPGAASRGLRIGSASPPGWVEFDRWWAGLTADGTEAALGETRVYQAKFVGTDVPPLDFAAAQVRRALPDGDNSPYWWQRGWTTEQGFAVWELSPDDSGARRRIVVLASENQDAQLSAWTWSQGQPDMPPLCRYSMHAAKLRYQARVRDDGDVIGTLIRQVVERADQLLESSRRRPADALAELGLLGDDEARLSLVQANVRDMLQTVRIAVDNMTKAQPAFFPADRELADWLPRQLGDDADYLTSARLRAEDLRRLLGPATDAAGPPPDGGTRPEPSEPDHGSVRSSAVPNAFRSARPSVGDAPGAVKLRMGFAVDIEGYSRRTSPEQSDLQVRLGRLVQQALGGLGISLEETDHQGTGDGMNVFLPAEVELHRALPHVLRSWRDHLEADNRRFRDRMRLRLATVVGPVGIAALGYSGSTIVKVSRMLDSTVLRTALRDNPHVDYAALVSEPLHEYVVGEGHPGLDPQGFRRVLVESKEYEAHAWLWLPA
ncbi:CATRA conflict system CASPASE/TPR repeat-associated protein [Streptomyces rishiriensis]|uniref:CATRA conflict system CASPASE/TPR repeat-associated protein n=1 Tax=Streptomyces rishiriensis TaxID=68264 RepID=UPI000D59206C|nr:CATRA conflict system CASPASE/TPR repeat-associated protein [Streptomyces rishiriensis]